SCSSEQERRRGMRGGRLGWVAAADGECPPTLRPCTALIVRFRWNSCWVGLFNSTSVSASRTTRPPRLSRRRFDTSRFDTSAHVEQLPWSEVESAAHPQQGLTEPD